jgi:peptide/nickel transport system permease protein
MPSEADSDGLPRSQQVDWERIDTSGRLFSAERYVLVAGLAALGGLFAYDKYVADYFLVGQWHVTRIHWAFLLGLVGLLAYGVVPAIRRRDFLRRVGQRVRDKPATMLAGGFLSTLLVVGILGPVFVTKPGLSFQYAFHPPVGFTSEILPPDCVGRVTGEVFNRRCHGSWRFPLGTDMRGYPMTYQLVAGARTAVYVLFISGMFVVPIATGVGVIAGFRGGLIDDLLMSYVDIQLSIPAVIVYFVGFMYFGPSLLLLLVSFGLLSWGGIARLVRSETLQRREDGYVLVVRSLGASRSYIAHRHILPNITNTLIPAVFHLLALFVLIEAGIAFLGFHDPLMRSWGSSISEALNVVTLGPMPPSQWEAHKIWWVSTLPALALTATLFSLKLLGDGLRDALDPRGGR